MGQYHYVANIDKREFLHPHKFGDGLKLMEFGQSTSGTACGLIVLLASACKGGGRGGGDVRLMDPKDPEGDALFGALVGRWAGDRISIIGDYHEEGDTPGLPDAETPWNDDGWRDISADVYRLLQLCGEVEQPRGNSMRPDMVIGGI